MINPDADVSPLLRKLVDPATRADPYPVYALLRGVGPLRAPGGVTVFPGYDDCLAVLRDPTMSSERRRSTGWQEHAERLRERVPDLPTRWTPPFLRLDPPDHTRLRGLVSSVFTPRMVEQLRPFITGLIDDLLDRAAERGRLELIEDLAYPLPVAVICRLLGVPLDDEPLFHTWSATLARSLDPIAALTPDDAEPEHAALQRLSAARQLREYLAGLIERRRREPGQDLISALIAAHDVSSRLSQEEMVSTCVLLLIAGHETTVNLIANATLALLRHPDQWRALAGDPERSGRVVAETLRYDPPVQLASRVATADTAVGGVTVPAGGIALLLIGATGRDPRLTEEPEAFDPDRHEVRALAFGMGPHYCLGAPLARLETQLALTRMTQRLERPRLAQDPPPYKPNVALRGVEAMPIDVDAVTSRDREWPAAR
jgi:cytochrome P450